jgi:selenocysteine lyase/cysteine desulfurase
MVAEWGTPAIAQRLAMLTGRIEERVRSLGARVLERRVRAPHVLCLGFADGLPQGLVEALAADGVYVAARLGRLRVSPHVFNDEADTDRFVAALTRRRR